jgi:hypothetical protein
MTAPAAKDQRAWLAGHLAALRRRLDKLRKVEVSPGKGGAERAKTAADAADKLERRMSRLMRAAAHLDNQAAKTGQHARRLMRSKNPRDRAEVVVNAAAELPVDLALEVGEQILAAARARGGQGP